MNPEEIEFNQSMALAQAKQNQMLTQQAQQDYMIQEQEKSMIREQLDLNEELETIKNLLKGNILEQQPNGETVWVPPIDKEMIILSDYGIHLVMNTIRFYINKDTLLSNYDEETINQKMEDFACDLNDTIFMEYEKVFQYPEINDCKKVLMDRLDKKRDLRKFALELLGQKTDDEKIKKQLIDEMEGRIEKEINNIREQLVKNKLKRFLILLRSIQDIVHSTYLRALNGAERRTLRQHIHISESRNPYGDMKPSGSKLNPMNWGKR